MIYKIGEVFNPGCQGVDQDMWLVEIDRLGEFLRADSNKMDAPNHEGVIEVRGHTEEEARFNATEIVNYLNSKQHIFKRKLARKE